MSTASTTTPGHALLTPLEIVSGGIRGFDDPAPDFPLVDPLPTGRAAFEQIVLDALRRPPCVVSFSGGRDSSAVLAVATHVARREGLPPPVPVSMRFPRDPETREDGFQDMVLGHLEIEDRVVLSFTDELDILGPYAREILRAHGVLFPANAHFHLPIAAQAPEGTVLTGFGGDETLTSSPLCVRVNQVLTRQVRPEGRDALRLAAFFGPRPLRRAALGRRVVGEAPIPWLRPAARKEIRRAELADLVAEPIRWDQSLVWWWRTRYRRQVADALDRVTSQHGATACSPFADPLVLASMGREWGRVGVPSRSDAMKHMFGDLLPPELTGRSSKATFSPVFAGAPTWSFLERWDGSGVDEELVDTAILRDELSGPEPAEVFQASTLIQGAWLATEGASDHVGPPSERA